MRMLKSVKSLEFNEELKREILAMVAEDQRIRMGSKLDPKIDERHTKRLKEIIQRFGWPGKSLVGQEAADRVWLLVQHADHDIDFQRQALILLQEAAKKGEVEKKYIAYLIDRIRVHCGQPQIFGTQFYVDDEGNFGPRRIEDRRRLGKRRKEYGLQPFVDYERAMQKLYGKFSKGKKLKKS